MGSQQEKKIYLNRDSGDSDVQNKLSSNEKFIVKQQDEIKSLKDELNRLKVLQNSDQSDQHDGMDRIVYGNRLHEVIGMDSMIYWNGLHGSCEGIP